MWHWNDVRCGLHGLWLQMIDWRKLDRAKSSGHHGAASSALAARSLRCRAWRSPRSIFPARSSG